MNKASYYVNEYANTFLLYLQNGNNEAIDKLITRIYLDLSDDVIKICKMRNSRSNDTLLGALRDVNNKWNAIGRGLEKKTGFPILKENGFLIAWFNTMPEIKYPYVKRYGPIN